MKPSPRPMVAANKRRTITTTTTQTRRGRRRSDKEPLSSGPVDRIGRGDSNVVSLSYMPLFSASTRKRLTYYDSGSLTTTSGTLNSYVFSVNGLYDPNITGTGHQPAGFDQMMIFYDHYVVVGAKATVTYYNTSSAARPQIALSLNSTVTPVTDITVLNETGYVVRDYLNNSGVDSGIKTLSMTCNVAKFQGVPQPKDDPELWGTAAANPVEQSYYNISVWDNNAVTCAITFQILMEFDVWFIEPRKISSSLTGALHKLIMQEEKHK